jgi:hypothetical protein
VWRSREKARGKIGGLTQGAKEENGTRKRAMKSRSEDEADLREVMVRGQDFAQLEFAHDNKASAVGE